MPKENIYEPFEIVYKTLDVCPKMDHQHTFFELVYILDGKGKQCINQNGFDYHADHMFLLTPNDCHRFDIEERTTFFFLRFTDIYFRSSGFLPKHIQQLEFILQNANHQPGCILKNQSDKQLVRPIIESIIREVANSDLYNKELIEQLINTLIVVIARNIAKYQSAVVNEYTEEKIIGILQYIQNHIYSPQLLRSEQIGQHLNLSDTYLGRYFKKHTGETLQQYVTNYRMRLIENRLKHSDLRINEIAFTMGFTDESHLNKFFRKNKGLSPLAFRKKSRLVSKDPFYFA
jgi:AraC-like DNA-binding protein